MRRVIKSDVSEIVTQGLSYPRDSKTISSLLQREQLNLCAYTEDKITSTFTPEIEHFNPTIKNTPADGYTNWFLVSGTWNRKKGTKNSVSRWNEHQPVFSPTDNSIDEQIQYDPDSGAYIPSTPENKQAENTIKYLLLDHSELSKERRAHINLLSDLLENDWDNDKEKLKSHLRKHQGQVKFARAINTVFQFDPIQECLQAP